MPQKYTAPSKVRAKAFKQRLVVDKETKSTVFKLSKMMAHLWNMGVEQSRVWLEQAATERKKPKEEREETTPVTSFSFNLWLKKMRDVGTEIEVDGSRELLSSASIDVSRQILARVADGWKAFFEAKKRGDTEVRPPMPMNTDHFQALQWSAQNIKLQNGIVSLPGFSGGIKLRFSLRQVIAEQRGSNRPKESNYLERMIGKNGVRYLTLTYDWREDKFFLSCVVGLPLTPPKTEQPTLYRAIDLGAGNIAVSDSDGSEFLIPLRRPDKWHQPEITKIEKRLGKRKVSKKLKRARSHAFERQSDQLETFQKQLAHRLAEKKVECIVVGMQKIRLGLAQSEDGTPKQHYGVQNTGNLFRLVLFLRSKCEERGIQFLELPDPQREGGIDDPESKFRASRKLLDLALDGTGLEFPTSFIRKGFRW